VTSHGTDHRSEDHENAVAGIVLAALGPMALAAALVSVRDVVDNTNVALGLVIVVLIAALTGGRTAGAVAAISSVLAFDFFHTQPYLSLTIDSQDDVITTILLLPIGLLVGTVAGRARQARRAAEASKDQMHRVHRIAELAARGEVATVVLEQTQHELNELLGLTDSRFEAPPYDDVDLPVVERSGAVLTDRHRYTLDGFELPHGGAALPVLARGRPVGRFVLVPTPGTGVSLDRRIVAVALADQAGAALRPLERSSNA
jgi:K+-sensing histidine kinase KdpD